MSLPSFGVKRPVPARLLMTATIIAGLFASFTLRREFFPEMDPEAVLITLPYPGATPQEIEESMARKVEDAIVDVDNVEEIRTTLSEGNGSILAELRSGSDIDEALDDLERAVDQITDLPDEAEEIRITTFEPTIHTVMVTLYGDSDEEILKSAIRAIADDLRTLPGMGDIVLSGVRDYEVRVDVSQTALLEHGISLPQVSDAIHAWMNDVPGGAMRTSVGTINVRTLGVAERGEAIRQIVVKATPSGQSLRVDDIASVREDFVDHQIITRFNGRPSVSLTVFKTGDQDAIEIAEMVRAYVAGRRGEPLAPTVWERLAQTNREAAWALGAGHQEELPGELATHADLARFIEGRLQLLTDNALQGAVLIFLTIVLALNLRTGWWVMTGLFTALCGTLLLMSWFGITLNLLTMFGLLITLGMLEDDAIVVSENIIARHERGEPPAVAAIKGAEEVFWPVIATVLTTIVAFLPLTFVRGSIGDLLGALPWVVFCSLLISVIETNIMLPGHMAHSLANRDQRRPGRIGAMLRRLEAWRDRAVVGRIIKGYARFVRISLEYRYISTAAALAILIISLGLVAGGRVEFTFLPASDSETIIVNVRLPIGSPLARTESVAYRIQEAARAQPETRYVSTIVGESYDIESNLSTGSFSHVAQLFVELIPVEDRDRESSQVIQSIRAEAGNIDEAETVRFSEISGGPGGADITIRVIGADDREINAVAAQVKSLLQPFEGVHDIADDNYASQRELQIELKPGAAAMGFTVADVARQVRGSLFGLDPHVFSARREDTDVRVRLDEDSRRSLQTIDDMWMISPTGARVPLREIADLQEGTSFSTIQRIDRQRVVTVTADASPGANPEEIVAGITPALDQLVLDHPATDIVMAGRQKDLMEAFETLPLAFGAALLMIYGILACLFSSYTQPLAVMIAIPFGIIGMVWGHLLLGYQMTFLSMIGFVALSGVVVNNSLILVEFYNKLRAHGLGLRDALVEAGRQRLRAITLTSITTVLGLMPLILEKSFQAKFLIPMAISISFGLLSATILTLMVLPCIIVIIDDLKRAADLLWFGESRAESLEHQLPAPAE